MANSSLGAAKKAKNDEFYTQFDDVQKELNHYKDQFKGKVVYCNCDDPAESAFADFFKINFEFFGLKKLICTRYSRSTLFDVFDHVKQVGYKLEITGRNDVRKIELEGDGDFRNTECVDLLKEADIVCTNPPFSLAREYITQLMQYDKKFLIVGDESWPTYQEVFPLLQQGKLWPGYNRIKEFKQPDGNIKKFGNKIWWTNLDVAKRHEELTLYEEYSPEKYPSYDNFEGISVDKTSEIPKDFLGVMGVPISFLDKFNPSQFEIIGITKKVGFHLRTKIYPKQIQVDKNGTRSEVTKLNDGVTIRLNEPPDNKTYYIVNGEYFIQCFPRILIKRKVRK